MTNYQGDPASKAKCFETVRDSIVPASESSGGYAISVVGSFVNHMLKCCFYTFCRMLKAI